MFHYQSIWTESAVRRFIARVGLEYIDDLILLQRADMASMKRPNEDYALLDELKTRVDKQIEEKQAFTIKDLKTNGNDLFNEAGIPRGPLMGRILEGLLEMVHDDPSLNEKSLLLKEAKILRKTYSEDSEEK